MVRIVGRPHDGEVDSQGRDDDPARDARHRGARRRRGDADGAPVRDRREARPRRLGGGPEGSAARRRRGERHGLRGVLVAEQPGREQHDAGRRHEGGQQAAADPVEERAHR